MKFWAGWSKNALHGAVALLLGGMLACSGSGHVVGADTAPVTSSNEKGEPGGHFWGGVPAPKEASGVATSCTAFALPTDASGVPACDLLNVVASPTCDCSAPGLTLPSDDDTAQVQVQARIAGLCPIGGTCNVCACKILPATGASLDQCTSPTPDSSATGWCYVSAEQSSAASSLVASTCSLKEQHEIRFLGPDIPADTATLELNCNGGQLPILQPQAGLGEVCASINETFPTFRGYEANDIAVENHSPSCRTGICLQNHFQGRASCPYGQPNSPASLSASPPCLVAGSDVPVEGPVAPQLVDRRANVASICSCQCDGYGLGPYCTCGDGMECVHLIDEVAIPGDPQGLAGSYCIPTGSEYSHSQTSTCTDGACGASHPF